MSLSDCIHCWDTPCVCGWDYRTWPVLRLDEQIAVLQRVRKWVLKNPKRLDSTEAYNSWLREVENDKTPPEEEQRVRRLQEALEFYADPENWKQVETGIGMHDGAAVDYGTRAREALGRE